MRHGQTQWNAEGDKYCGRTDIPLTPKGISQAQDVAQQLAGISFEAIYSSPLERAFHTAQIAGGGKPVIKDERLLETDFGAWEGKTKKESIEQFPELAAKWERDPANNRAGGTGETAQMIVNRADDFFDSLQKKYAEGNVLVVAHNGLNRFYLTYKLGMPLKNYHQLIQENSRITLFTLDKDDVLVLHRMNSRLDK
ncbi:MAG TPA: histidine phosphatase family protein [Chitinophagaceae bacterium]